MNDEVKSSASVPDDHETNDPAKIKSHSDVSEADGRSEQPQNQGENQSKSEVKLRHSFKIVNPQIATPNNSESSSSNRNETSNNSSQTINNSASVSVPQPASVTKSIPATSNSKNEENEATQAVNEVAESEPDPTVIPTIKRGRKPGDRYIQVMRTTQADVARLAPKYVQLNEEDLTGRGGRWRRIKRFLIGQPISTSQSHNERLNKIRALAIYASDALSSVAYATEATLFVLVTIQLQSNPTVYVIPISIAICVLIALVVNSYRQTVHAYPGGGGSYIVSKDNLGTNPGLVAAAAILIDYTLTVAVSITAGVAAITSAIPALNQYQIEIGVGMIALLTLANLRGIRESGTIFAVPTYLFIFSFLGLLGYGFFKVVTGDFTPYSTAISSLKPATTEIPDFNTHPLTLFLVLVAFTQGCSALTGVEAISDGVQSFKKPESRNAAITLLWLGGLLIVFFLGTSFLADHLHAFPDDPNNPNYETIISKIGRNLVGGNNPFYYIVQASTALILILAANTAFADFPRLSFFLARDKFMPNIFSYRGDRLAFTTGIVVLAVFASILLIQANGHTDALIPLYAIGVFLAFTLSQSGMVVHWQKEKKKGTRNAGRYQLFNIMGAIATALVLGLIVVTKFLYGAWLIIILIPIIFFVFKAINRHYTQVADFLRIAPGTNTQELARKLPINATRSHKIVIPISGVNKASLMALDFARSLGDDTTALFISDDSEAIEALSKQWQTYKMDIPLVILENPFRSILPPLLNYLDTLDSADTENVLMVVLPEFVTRHWWEQLLHNQTALRIKSALLARPGLVVIDVPYHMERDAKTKSIV